MLRSSIDEIFPEYFNLVHRLKTLVNDQLSQQDMLILESFRRLWQADSANFERVCTDKGLTKEDIALLLGKFKKPEGMA
jgi:hypothetical protein